MPHRAFIVVGNRRPFEVVRASGLVRELVRSSKPARSGQRDVRWQDALRTRR
jgi:hypothetical protein